MAYAATSYRQGGGVPLPKPKKQPSENIPGVEREDQPRRRHHSWPSNGSASLAARTRWAAPPVLRGVDRAGAEIVDADSMGVEVVQVHAELTNGRVEGNIDRFILEDILRDDGTRD